MKSPIFNGILEDLVRREPTAEQFADKLLLEQVLHTFPEDDTQAAFCYFVIKKCAESDDDDIEIQSLANFSNLEGDQAISNYFNWFITPLYEYLNEHLVEQNTMLNLLRRYKHKCEWFQRYYLYELWSRNTERGEKLLSFHLYEYLHDQGLDFTIEPYSASGEADLVSSQSGDEPLIADAKIFNPDKSKGKSYIVRGFHQIYQYTLDFNEPFGYLIIFKTCEKDLKFALANAAQSTPFVTHNNKTIYLLTIDIYPHAEPASRRGPLETEEITENELIRAVDAAEEE
jgi:hypothetical protein